MLRTPRKPGTAYWLGIGNFCIRYESEDGNPHVIVWNVLLVFKDGDRDFMATAGQNLGRRSVKILERLESKKQSKTMLVLAAAIAAAC